jgi:O-antigen/teichoic acid export membrane protein
VALWVLVLREFLTVTCYFVERFYIPLFANCIGLLALLLYLFFVVPSESFLKVTLGFEIIGVYILPGLIVYIYTLFTGKLNSYTLPINELFSSSFRDGKWALLQGLFYFIRTQSRTMISLLILSAWHVGLINAAYLMVALPIVMISGLVQQALPQLTSLSFESGEYKKNIILLIAVIAALTLFYAAFIFAFHEILTEKILSPEILLYS